MASKSFVDLAGLQHYDGKLQEKIGSTYLPLSGGTMTGTIVANAGNIIKRDVTDNILAVYGGTSSSNGARAELYGGTRSINPGSFLLTASIDSSTNTQLLGKPDGTLTWGGTAISLNGHTHSYLPLSGGTLTDLLSMKYGTPNIGFFDTNLTKGTNPAAAQWSGIYFCDKTGNTGAGYRSAALEPCVNTNGTVSMYMRAYNWVASNTTNAYIAVHYPVNGTAYTEAPTPAVSDNSTKIATTAYVKAQGYITSSGSITGSAAKLGTATVGNVDTPIYLNAGTATAVNSALKSCYAVVESEAVTNNIFKIASGSMGGGYNGLNAIILIQNIMGVNAAIWRISLNVGATAGVYNSATSVLIDNVGMSTDNFILAYKSNSGSAIDFELYAKIPGRYSGYRFTVIQECWRSNQKLGNILTLYNNLTSTGSAAISSGFTAITTTKGTVTMDINGNAATATKATQDGSGNNIVNTYATKSELNDITSVTTAQIDTLF